MTEQDQASQIRSTPYQSPMYNYGSGMVLLTNPSEVVHNLELTYRNMYYDKNNNLISAGDPLMNTIGIMAVIGQVQSVVNKVTIMSFLNENEIRGLMLHFADTLIQNLMMKRIAYEIKDNSTRTMILTMAEETAFVTMKRAFEEGDRRFWKGSVQEIKQEVTQSPQKKGLFGMWRN